MKPLHRKLLTDAAQNNAGRRLEGLIIQNVQPTPEFALNGLSLCLALY
jgi:hypothetical protein